MTHPIRKIRQELGLTQVRLARLAEVHPVYISWIESGSRKPSAKVLSVLREIGYDPNKVAEESQEFADTVRKLDLQNLKASVA